MSRRAHLFGLASVLSAAVLLGGCGVRGPLEPPPGAQAATPAAPATSPSPAKPASGAEAAYVPPRSAGELTNSVTPHADWEKTKTGKKPDPLQGAHRPDQPFFLDFLL